MAKVQKCSLEVGEFELKSRYSILFQTNILGKGMNPLFPVPAIVQIVQLLIFYKVALALNNPRRSIYY